jgi:hypothetical protein
MNLHFASDLKGRSLQFLSAVLSPVDLAQLSRLYLKQETESSLRNVSFLKINRTMFLDNDRTMDNVQNSIVVVIYHRHILLYVIGILHLIYCTIFISP